MNIKEMEALTIDQVAELLNVSARAVQRLISEGNFARPIKIGRLSRWLPSDVREFLEKLSKQRSPI